MSRYALPTTRCPHCDRVVGSTLAAGRDEPPSPGDPWLCVECGRVAVFGAGLGLERPSPAAMLAVMTGPAGDAIRRDQAEVRAGRRPDRA